MFENTVPWRDKNCLGVIQNELTTCDYIVTEYNTVCK